MLRYALTWLITLLLSLSVMVSALSPAWSQTNLDLSLPSLTSSNTQVINGEEVRLGRAWLRQFRAHAPAWEDPISEDYVNTLVARLLPHSELSGIDTVVTLVASDRLNAFAVPGGVIGINAGLFAFAEQEAAMVSVLAHELGHLSQRHYARGKARAEQMRLPAMAAMLAGMLVAASGGGDVGIAAAVGSQAALYQDQLAYSRRFEQEADRIGLQAMASAGYDPQATVDLFRTMQRQLTLQGGNPPEFLLTHPLTESRITDAQSRANQIQVTHPRAEDLAYHLVRARALLAIYDRDPSQAATRLKRSNPPEAAQRYLAALIDAEKKQTDSALRQLDTLAQAHPDLAMLPASAVDVALKAGRVNDAIERARRQLRLMPGYQPTQLMLGEALLQTNPNDAYFILNELADQRPEDPQVFALLAEAAGRSEREAWGHLARAEHQQLTGHIDRAIQQLDVAQEIAKRHNDLTASNRIKQRREAFIGYRETMEEFQ
ncbi:M48 family metalloprotease [Halomonas halocynthiae]|uniref:M48 family metalloprotease n=1 Tax=Halomonas halocynthiae TaxID=176290 RepID=UPI00041A4440|nr:M48 family metalloprotease [Halomonas halocynthiae]